MVVIAAGRGTCFGACSKEEIIGSIDNDACHFAGRCPGHSTKSLTAQKKSDEDFFHFIPLRLDYECF